MAQVVKKQNSFNLECTLQAMFAIIGYMAFCFSESIFSISYWQLSQKLESIVRQKQTAKTSLSQVFMLTIFFGFNIAVPLCIGAFDLITLLYNKDYLTGKGAEKTTTWAFTARQVALSTLCVLLFVNAAIILMAILNIRSNVKKVDEGLRAELRMSNLAWHLVVGVLFTLSLVPLIFFSENFFGKDWTVC